MKLLNKSFRPFAIFTVLVVLLSVPAYYYVIQIIYLKDADDSLYVKKEKIQDRVNELSLTITEAYEIIHTLNSLEIGISIEGADEAKNPSNDQIYTIERFDAYHGHEEPFRVLESSIIIHDETFNIKIEVDLDEFNDVIPYTATLAGLFFTLILTGYYFVNKRVSQKTWNPFLKTIQSLEKFSISSNTPLPEIKSDIEEFQKLSDILQTYNQNNRAVFLQQKSFIENASHELQTPIMILNAKADALMQTAELNENQLSVIDEMNQIIGRMTKINRNLLLLAKIDNNQFDIQEDINLKHCLEKELEFFSDLSKNKNLTIEKKFESDLIISGNKTLTEILINNLLRNAINHSSNPGKIVIRIKPNELLISNTSETGELDGEKIFQRFFKTNTSGNNSGLGLSICKEICKIYNWDIKYSFQNNFHQFSLKF